MSRATRRLERRLGVALTRATTTALAAAADRAKVDHARSALLLAYLEEDARLLRERTDRLTEVLAALTEASR